jgi:hypothetical protein
MHSGGEGEVYGEAVKGLSVIYQRDIKYTHIYGSMQTFKDTELTDFVGKIIDVNMEWINNNMNDMAELKEDNDTTVLKDIFF